MKLTEGIAGLVYERDKWMTRTEETERYSQEYRAREAALNLMRSRLAKQNTAGQNSLLPESVRIAAQHRSSGYVPDTTPARRPGHSALWSNPQQAKDTMEMAERLQSQSEYERASSRLASLTLESDYQTLKKERDQLASSSDRFTAGQKKRLEELNTQLNRLDTEFTDARIARDRAFAAMSSEEARAIQKKVLDTQDTGPSGGPGWMIRSALRKNVADWWGKTADNKKAAEDEAAREQALSYEEVLDEVEKLDDEIANTDLVKKQNDLTVSSFGMDEETVEKSKELNEVNQAISDLYQRRQHYKELAYQKKVERELAKIDSETWDMITKVVKTDWVKENHVKKQSTIKSYMDALKKRVEAAGADYDILIEYAERVKKEEHAQQVNASASQFAKEQPFLASVVSIPVGIVEGIGGAISLTGQKIANDFRSTEEYLPLQLNSAIGQSIRGTIGERLEHNHNESKIFGQDLESLLYQTGMSTLDSAFVTAATMGLGSGLGLSGQALKSFASAATTGTISMGAATATFADAKARGLDDNQAFSLAVASGLIEAATEKFSVEALLKEPKSVVGYVVKNTLTEASEETVSEVANKVADVIIAKDRSEWNMRIAELMQSGMTEAQAMSMAFAEAAQDVAASGLGGALSGGGMAGGGLAGHAAVKYYGGKFSQKGTQEIEQTLMNAAHERAGAEASDQRFPAVQKTVEQEFSQANNTAELGQQYGQIRDAASQAKKAEMDQDFIGIDREYGVSDYDLTKAKQIPRTNSPLEETSNVTSENLSNTATAPTDSGINSQVIQKSEENSDTEAFQYPKKKSIRLAQARMTESGTRTVITGVSSVTTNNVMLETASGKTVAMSDISFDDPDVQDFYKGVEQYDTRGANAYLRHYNKNMPVDAYKRSFDYFYRAGQMGVSLTSAANFVSHTTEMLGLDAARAAYNTGANAAKAEISLRAPEAIVGRPAGTFTDQTGHASKGFSEIARLASKKLGVDIEYVPSLDGDNGQYLVNRAKILIAADSKNNFTALMHELGEHMKAQNPEGADTVARALVNWYAQKQGYSVAEEVIANYRKNYEEYEGSKTFRDAMDEFSFDLLGALFGSEEGLKSFLRYLNADTSISINEKRSILQRIADLLKRIVSEIREMLGDSSLDREARHALKMEQKQVQEMRRMVLDALDQATENSKQATKNAASEGDGGMAIEEVRMSLNTQMEYSDAVDAVLEMDDETILRLKSKNPYVQISQTTPEILIDRCGCRDLPLIIRLDALYLETRNDGILEGNYHGLGTSVMKNLEGYLSSPDLVLRTDNGRILVIAGSDAIKSGQGIISLEINTVKDIGSKYDYYNVVVTMFGLKQRYFKNLFKKRGAEMIYKKETLPQVNPQLHEWLGIVNGSISDTSLSQADTSVNRQYMQRSGEDSGNVRHSLNPDFARKYDEWDKQTGRFSFKIGTTSEPLKSIGVKDQNIWWDATKIKKIKDKHPAMTDEVIKQVPNILEYPILIMESQTVPGRLTLFGEVYDVNNNPVLAVLELNPTGKGRHALDIIKIASAYGKDTNPQRLIDQSRILYVDPNKNRTNSWLSVNRLQLPLPSSSYGSIDTISSSDGDVNSQYMQRSGDDSGKVKRVTKNAASGGDEMVKHSFKGYAEDGRGDLVYSFSAEKEKLSPQRTLHAAVSSNDHIAAKGKLSKGAPQLHDAQSAPTQTPKSDSVVTPIDTIASSDSGVNSDSMQRSGEDSGGAKRATKNVASGGDGMVKYSLKENDYYTYEHLVSLPDIPVVKMDEQIRIPADRKEAIRLAKKSVRDRENPRNTDQQIYVHNDSVNADILVGTRGIVHGFRRNFSDLQFVEQHLGEYLENAVLINELNPRDDQAVYSYVLLGYGESEEAGYPAYFVVNVLRNMQHEIYDYGVLYSANTKRMDAPANAARDYGKSGSPLASAISISDLLGLVKTSFSEILPDSVLKHYSIERREGKISDSVRYSLPVEETQALYKGAEQYDTRGANAYLRHYNGNMPVDAYKRSFDYFYRAGQMGVSLTSAANFVSHTTEMLGLDAAQAAYNTGANAAKQATKNAASGGDGGKSSSIRFSRKASYPYDMQKVIGDYIDAVDDDFKAFIEGSLNRKNRDSDKYFFKKVEPEAAKMIQKLTGINVDGFDVAIESRMIQHIQKRHGSLGNGDHSMKDINDLARLEYVLSNYDSISDGGYSDAYSTVKPNGKTGRAKTVLYAKKINGTYFVSQAVPDTKRKTLFVVTAYINKKGVTQLADTQSAPTFTPENGSAATPSISLSQADTDVNRQIMQRSGEDSGNVRHSINPEFARKYDEWDKKGDGFSFLIGTVSEPLDSIGVNSSEIYFDAAKIKKIRDKHPAMTDEVIKQVPNILEYPILIMESQTVPGRLTLFGEVYDANNNPVLVALELNPTDRKGHALDIIKIASAYGKDTNPQRLIDQSRILYVDPNKNRTNSWLGINRLQLPLPSTSYGSIDTISSSDGDVNRQYMQRSGEDSGNVRHSLPVEDDSEFSNPTIEEIRAIQGIGRKSINHFNSNDIEATRRYATRYWREMGTKSPFFRAWFGDWRENDTSPVQIATVQNAERGMQHNEDTGWDIMISGKVFNESQHRGTSNQRALPYLQYINDIVKKAILLDSYALGKAKSANSLLMHSLYSVADIGDGPELLKLYIEEIYDPNQKDTRKRSYQLQNIERQQTKVQGSRRIVSPIIQSTGIHTVADLFAAVKRKDANFNPDKASKVVDEDGKPLVVYQGIEERLRENGLRRQGGAFVFTQSREDAQAQAGKDGRVMEVYVNLRKPVEEKMLHSTESLQDQTEQISRFKQQGYDGWIVNTQNGQGEVVAFYPEQVKSATDNVGTFDRGHTNIRHSLNLEFAREYEAWDRKVTGFSFVFETKSEALKKAGIRVRHVQWDAGKIKKIKDKHPGMTDEMIKQVPNVLEHPILIMESQTVPGRLTLFGEVYDANNNPILAALELNPIGKNGHALDIIKIASAYGKDVSPQRLIDQSRILYVDPNKNRTNSWLSTNGLQLPKPSTSYGSIDTISSSDGDVNSQYMQRSGDDSGNVRHSLNPDFARKYDEWNKQEVGFSFKIGTTSQPLKSVGVKKQNIRWDAAKIKKIKDKHPAMTDEVIKQVPNILEYPILIMESQTVPGRLTLFGEVYDANNNPVLAVLELNPTDYKGHILNIIKIASAYGKDTNPQRLIDQSRILYVDPNKNRTNSWLLVNRLQLPFTSTSYGSIDTISSSDESVNSQYMQRSGEDSGNVRHSFAGIDARTANIQRLEDAKERLHNGEDSETIRQETGWFQGADGKWRFEIDDRETVFDPEGRLNGADQGEYLSDYLQHDALYKAYPELRTMPVEIKSEFEMPPGALGAFVVSDNKIVLCIGDPAETKSVLLHEVQHAVQKIEGFSGGASLAYWVDILDEDRYPITKNIRDAQEALSQFRSRTDTKIIRKLDQYSKKLRRAMAYDERHGTDREAAVREEIRKSGLYEQFEELDRLESEVEEQKELALNMSPHELYFNTAGEIESRDVQFRARMLPEERRQKKPDTGDDKTVFSDQTDSYSIHPDFAREIDSWNREGRDGNDIFTLGSTGDVLQGLGARENDIYMRGEKISKILRKHPEMTLEEIKRIPEILEDPILVLASRNRAGTKTGNTRLVMFGSVKAQNGKPVLCVLDLMPVENRILIDDLQKLTSAYTKTKNPAEFIQSSDVLYISEHKKRAAALLSSIGLQIWPTEVQHVGSLGSISYRRQDVNISGVPFYDITKIKQTSRASELSEKASDAGIASSDSGVNSDSMQKFGDDSGNVRHSLNMEFAREYDAWDRKVTGFSFVFETKSEALKKAGIRVRHVQWDAGKIRRMMERHPGMTDEMIKQAPNVLEHPILIMEPKEGARRLLFVGEIYDAGGRPAQAIVELRPVQRQEYALNVIRAGEAIGKEVSTRRLIDQSRILYEETQAGMAQEGKEEYINSIKPTLPKVARAQDTVLQNTVEVKSELINGIIPSGAMADSVRIIAGYGTSSDLRVAEELTHRYGGDDWKWEKKGGIIRTEYFAYDVHWYEYEGKQYRTKTKGVKKR